MPQINFGPDPDRVAVGYWTYLWVDDAGPLTATATAGAVSSTATATLESVTWSTGEPVSPEQLGSSAPPITCDGSGYDPGPEVNILEEPPAGACAYLYSVRSTDERTGGSGTWPVTATATWSISWSANTGESGALTAPPVTATTDVHVGSWSTVFVAGG